jgi:hypothetical protein
MFKRLLEMAKQLLTLTQETQHNKAEIKELRQETRSLTEVVQRLVYEIHRVGERDEHERDKMKLWLENQLLRFERRLQLPQHDDGEKEWIEAIANACDPGGRQAPEVRFTPCRRLLAMPVTASQRLLHTSQRFDALQ